MTDKAELEKAIGWPISDHEFTILLDVQQRVAVSADQLVSLLHLMRDATPLTLADFQEDRPPKRPRIHDRRPWPVPKRWAF